MEREIKKIVDRVLSEEINKAGLRIKNRILENKEKCSECGGNMYEGECMECGTMYEGDITELGGMDDGHPSMGNIRLSDYSFEELDDILKGKSTKKGRHHSEEDDEDEFDFVELDLDEDESERMYESKKLSKGQKHIAKQEKPYDEIDAGDFKKLREKKSETKEGAKPDFLDLDDDGDKKEPMKSAAKQAKGKKVEETYYRIENFGTTLFTENEMVDMIEKIIKENTKYEKGKVSTSNVLKSSLNRSGKDENDYIKSVTEKMKAYLKNASKGNYEMNPKHFPKGNGELEEMEKMAYMPSDAVKDYTKNLTAAALENLDYDGINPDEEWVTDNVVGSSRTGNNPEWANAVETDVNKDRNQIRKDNMLAKIKKQAYNKAAQPIVNDKSGNKVDKADQIMIKLESIEDKKVISEMEKIKNLIGYSQKTQ
jgi:hypothetical protein